jgi:hypothetical protein
VLFYLLAKGARTKQGECGALVVKGHISNPRYRLRLLTAAPLFVHRRYLIVVHGSLHAAPLAVRRRYLIVMPRPLLRCASQVLDRGAQADASGAAQVIGRGAQAVAQGAARCASQVLDGGAQAVAHGAARCGSQVLDRGAKSVARSAATLLQQEKNNSADAQRNGVKISGFI